MLFMNTQTCNFIAPQYFSVRLNNKKSKVHKDVTEPAFHMGRCGKLFPS